MQGPEGIWVSVSLEIMCIHHTVNRTCTVRVCTCTCDSWCLFDFLCVYFNALFLV